MTKIVDFVLLRSTHEPNAEGPGAMCWLERRMFKPMLLTGTNAVPFCPPPRNDPSFAPRLPSLNWLTH